MCVKLWLRFGLLIILMDYLNHNNAFRMKWTNLVCESFNKSWVVYKECRLRAVSRNKTTMTAFVNILEPANNIFVRGQVLKRANGYKPWLMDYTIDACKFLRRRYHPFANIVYKLFKDVSNINHTCPYMGLHGLKDFYNIDSFPLMFPTGDYLLNITWIFDRKPQFVTSVYFAFWE